ncbi:hypothetical protein Acr_00g0059610 [Actinidia rufa]|uniref:Retrovirus-related Pol polyprotein from transposon TNT 1-94-like beta-barrel domain-containing protein n=1 Tax=Actinidia rufa TaxID=165716 RepID=A0A7J0DN59_9ERIC|nr:hypothetical protein Acr_00g0059610 [Actinidia rufa]
MIVITVCLYTLRYAPTERQRFGIQEAAIAHSRYDRHFIKLFDKITCIQLTSLGTSLRSFECIAADAQSKSKSSTSESTISAILIRSKTERALPMEMDKLGCSSRRYGAPAPNRVGNGVRTRPHASFEDRRVRSVSATRPGRSHALPRAQGRTHAPAHAKEELPRARRVAHAPVMRREGLPRAFTRQRKGEPTRHARLTRQELSDFDSLALPEVSRHSEFICEETSAYELWIKLEEMYQPKTSRNKALLMRRLVNLKLQRETTVAEHMSEFQSLVNQLTSVDLQFDDEMQALLFLSSLLESWETLVVSLGNSAPNGKLTTSMVMDALFNEEARRSEMGSTDQILDDGKSDWVLDSSSAYHLCRDREVFSTYAACEGRIWMTNNTSSRVVGRGSVRFRMADGRDAGFEASGGILRVFKGNKEMLWGKKTRGLYRLEGSVQTGGATVRHGSSGISEKSGQGKQPLHRGMQSKRRGTWRIRSGTRAQGNALGYVQKSDQTRVVQPVQDVHRETQRKETKSILRSCTAKGSATPKRVSFALDLISGGVLSSWHFGEKVQALRCGGAYTSVGSGVAVDEARYLGCCLTVLWGSWIRSCQEGQLKDIGLPSSGLEGEIVESSPSV